MPTICICWPSIHIPDSSDFTGITVIAPRPARWPGQIVGPDSWDALGAGRWLASVAPAGAVLVAGSEDAVLPVGLANLYRTGSAGLSVDAAIRCTDRKRQREALPPHLSPGWLVDRSWNDGGDVAVKAPVSSMSEGVILTTDGPYARMQVLRERARLNMLGEIQRLAEVAGELGYTAITERAVAGPQVEVSGVVGLDGEPLLVFPPLLQVWDAGVIVRYQRLEEGVAAVTAAAVEAVASLRLTQAPFCVELREGPDGWVVIEVNGRLGADGLGYGAQLSPDVDPAVAVCRALAGT